MSENAVEADVREWLKQKRTKPHIYTSHELDVLFTFISGATITSIAHELNVSDTAVTTWLKALGIYEHRHPHRHIYRRIPWNSPLRCPRCGILLEYADGMIDGFCDWCYKDLQRAQGGVEDKANWSMVSD